MSQVSLDPMQRLVLASETVTLRSGIPVINGKALEDWQTQVTQEGESFTVHYSLSGSGFAQFGVEVHNPQLPTEPGWLRYWVGPADEFELTVWAALFSR
jgi:hypothetical protein